MSANESLIQSLIKEGWLKNPLLIDAFRKIDRGGFVPEENRDEAYGNFPLSIGNGQTISQPLTVAFMLELLQPKPGEKILDIGSGSGWTTALLAEVASKNEGYVTGIERIPELCAFGQKNLAKYFPESRAKILCGDGMLELQKTGPFDKILAGAAAKDAIPDTWKTELAIGGRIVAPINNSIFLLIKKTEKEWEEKEYKGFVFVPLIQQESGIKNQESPKKKPKPKKFYFLLSSCFLIFASYAVLANEIYRTHASYEITTSVTIAPGSGSRKIGETLKKSGVIRSKWAFVAYVSLRGIAASLKPGAYVFGHETIPDIAYALLLGLPYEHEITIPEGWTLQDIAAYLDKEALARKDEFTTAANGKSAASLTNKFSALADKPLTASLEGYLFPDTYRIFAHASSSDIILKMLENFDKKLAPNLRSEIAQQKKTIFQIVTMASLIEKEVRSDEDRAIVSGILWKRIKLGIPLQVDATIAYITGKNTVKISRNDTKIDSPYNTYQYRGLPQGPIANPGMSAIRTAVYPKSSPYLFYLSAPDGRTIFSKTPEEHNAAKVKYLK